MDQPHDKKDVTAARPNPQAKWLCGYGRIGLACAEGPNKNGTCCQLRPERARQLDNSHCLEQCSCSHICQVAKLRRRPELPSQTEMGPCIPQRADWYWRQTLMLNMAIFAAGVLLLCMSLPHREAIFAPGDLSQKHAQLLGNRLVSERCSLCHPNSHSGVAAGTLQDELCLKCHTQHLPAAQLRSPHDLPRAELVKLTAKWSKSGEVAGNIEYARTSCAICHLEHHGEKFDLTAISDTGCQACHQRKFPSLAVGHPQFERYPYRTQRHIAFDHVAHQQKHFGTKNEKFDCARCHVDHEKSDKLGTVLRSVDFQRACASCHHDAIQAAAVSGWAVLQLPSIEALDTQNLALQLSDWPESAQFGYEGEISVALRLLLAADPDLRTTLAQLPASGQLQAVSSDPQVRAAAARKLAQGMRRLVAEVATEGQVAWHRRLQVTAQVFLARELSRAELKLIDALSQGVPPDLFRQMEQQWFTPRSDIARQPSLPMHLASQAVPNDSLLSDDDSLLSTSPDDELLSANDELLLQPQATPPQAASAGTHPGATQLTKLRGAVHVAAGGWYLDHDLLALRYMPRGHADPTLAAWAEFVALLDTHNSPDTWQHAAASETGGHQAELSAIRRATDPATAQGLRRITDGQVVPGGCTQCHLLQVESNHLEPIAQWTSRKQLQTVRPFTKFDHSPHLTLPALSDCSYCHVVQTDRPDSLGQLFESAAHASPATAPSIMRDNVSKYLANEFIGMRLDQCAACHRPGGAKDACTNCHNYHVGSAEPALKH